MNLSIFNNSFQQSQDTLKACMAFRGPRHTLYIQPQNANNDQNLILSDNLDLCTFSHIVKKLALITDAHCHYI